MEEGESLLADSEVLSLLGISSNVFVQQVAEWDESEDSTQRTAFRFVDFGAQKLSLPTVILVCEELLSSLSSSVSSALSTPATVIAEKKRSLWRRLLQALYFTESNEVKKEGDNAGHANLIPVEHTQLLGNDVFVELGVKTGLSLAFSLMKQAWLQQILLRRIQEPAHELAFEGSLPVEVLSTVLQTLKSIAPLSLTNERSLSDLSIVCLSQINDFLDSLLKVNSNADDVSKRLASEITLSLVLQSGNLTNLLSWVNRIFNCISSYGVSSAKSLPCISLTFCHDVLKEIRERTVSLFACAVHD